MPLHVLFVFQFFSCLVAFVLAYNFALLVESERSVVDVLLVTNALAVIYCLLQLTAGPGESFVPFGIQALAFNTNRYATDARLVGPFDNPGSTAGYFTLMVLVCAVELMSAKGWRRTLVLSLVGLDLLGLVATANRTAFLILLVMFAALLAGFRRELGMKRVLTYAISGAAVLVIASAVVVAYTGFGEMFSRLETVTQTREGVPSTRVQTWPVAIEKIKKSPWFGEGPRFMDPEGGEQLGWTYNRFDDLNHLNTAYDPYPHSLYLYLLRTVGVFGLGAVLWFFIRAWLILRDAQRRGALDVYASSLVRLGLLLIPAFLVAQITLEFNRPSTMDYAQFIFALMGLLVGTSDRSGDRAPATEFASLSRSTAAPPMTRDGGPVVS